jgi:hypothetical protein
MDVERPAKPPVVPSQLGALALVERWLVENRFDRVVDADGLAWRLAIQVEHVPAAARRVAFQLRLVVATEVTAGDLVATGTLAKTTDERLIELLGEDRVTLRMRPEVHVAASEDEAKARLTELLPALRERLAGTSLHLVKRRLVGRHIDERCRLGGGAFG